MGLTKEWWAREKHRLWTQPDRYERAMKPKRDGLRYEQLFAAHNDAEHWRAHEEEARLENSWYAFLARVEREEIRAMGMLLDANWSNSNWWFEKVVRVDGSYGQSWSEKIYYDREGKRIDGPSQG